MLTGNGILHDQIWALKGKLSVSSSRGHGSFSVDWQQRGDAFEIGLSGTLGLGLARISGTRDGARLEMSGERPVFAEDVDELVHRVLELDIPVRPLQYWVRGQPAPGPFEPMTNGWRQDGWLIEFTEMRSGLPRRLKLVHPEARIIMVVTEWQN